ncbi:hypothetical protein K432DRAFT_287065 [Lepidopterella palustris CBS 459.81]|uniref:Uncharacterized protein n=1 Tax=Lepidopterella palustris CBS 459.81 TaxID=1314670 RepID=A0A8E2EJQ6_9PEZI|nr:hypothetical protein K432DRAFT_287065 [Lepidopterella palustris CBS 459.81]
MHELHLERERCHSDSIYQPCSNDHSNLLSTVCCATNQPNSPGKNIANGFTQDICLLSSLCKNILTDANGEILYAYGKGYCTTNDYKSTKCPDVCTEDDFSAPNILSSPQNVK